MTDNEFKELIDNQVCHLGEGAPDASLGKEFDLYIDKRNHRFYRKSNDVWTSAPKEVIGQCVSYLKKDDLKEVVDEFLVSSGDGAAMVNQHNADTNAHLTGFNHRLTSNQLFDYELLPNTDFIQKGHLEERIKNADALKEHEKLVASNTDLGHVKVDGNSIIVENGVARSVGGKIIGEVFSHPSLVPPEGAFVLNGQYISNCSERFKEFYQWLKDNTSDELLLTPIYKPWTQTALTEDGTVGGDTYAARCSGTVTGTIYQAYRSFNLAKPSDNNFCSVKGVQSAWLEFYSPVALRFDNLDFQNPAVDAKNSILSDFQIFGSIDGTSYDLLASGTIEDRKSSAITSVELSQLPYSVDLTGYHYLKIEGTNLATSGNFYFPEVFIYAREYSHNDYRSKGNILSLTEEIYQKSLEDFGVCGGFVIDDELDRVRLPKLNGATIIGNDSADNGLAKFVASNSGDGTKLTAVPYSYCIQVYNATNSLSTQDAAFLTSQMQTKAQKDLVNVDSNIDFVIESWKDGNGNWYRKYRSGWCEQGGYIAKVSSSSWITVTFLVEMQDTNYFPSKMHITNSSSNTTERALACYELTTINMQMYCVANNIKTYWKVEGYAK